MNRIRALIKKEFYQIIRDPSSYLIAFLLPLILLFIYGYGVSLDLDHLKVGLVLQDTSPTAESFAKSLMDSKYFDLTITKEREVVAKEVTASTLRGLVIVPPYFTKFKEAGVEKGPIQVIGDGSEPNTANFVQNYVQGAYQNWIIQEDISKKANTAPPVAIQTRVWYNEALESRNFLIPGSLAIIMTLTGTLLTALVIAREWERGTMEALISTPVTIKEVLIGKLIPYFILGMAAMTMSVLVATLFYQVPLRGSILALALVSAVFLIPALGLGLLISSVAKVQVVASQLSTVSGFLPAFILSGFIFEIGSMPKLTQVITYIIPARYFVSCLQTLFLVGNVWGLIFWNLVPMIIVGSIFFLITAKRTVKRLD